MRGLRNKRGRLFALGCQRDSLPELGRSQRPGRKRPKGQRELRSAGETVWSPNTPRSAGAPISYAAGVFALLMGLWIITICNTVKRKNNNSEFFFVPVDDIRTARLGRS
jgi:hypothetical protein